jgi:capsular exopolysaccharide synthesis family protein
MEPASPPPRYLTLRDYLRVLRRYAFPIVLIAVIGALIGFLASVSQSKSYQATVSVQFRDPAQDITLLGANAPGGLQSPLELAQVSAETFDRPSVVGPAKQRLNTQASIGSLQGALSGAVSTAGLLQITATTSTPSFSAALANATANVIVEQTNKQARSQFARDADEVRRQISATPLSSPKFGTLLAIYEEELGRLDTLSRFAQGATVSKLAQPPGSPSAPNTLRNTLIGLALGLVLAIAVAFFRDAMDRRLRTAQEIEDAFQLPVLAHVRKQALGHIPQTMRNSRPDFEADLETFRILRRNLQFLNVDSPPRTVLVTSGLGEAGKTTVAGSLAFALASAGRRTLLVDCDLRRPAVAARLGIDAQPGISDFLAGEASPHQILRTIQVAEPPSANGGGPDTQPVALVAIPAGSSAPNGTELLGSRRFQDFLQQVVDTYDAVIIDSSPLLPVADSLEMLPNVDAAVICARESKTTRDEALAVKTALARFPRLAVGLVITGVTPSGAEGVVYTHAYAAQPREGRVPSAS